MEIRKIGVVGAGTMGSGIAQVAAQSGFDVVLVDIAANALAKGLATIDKSLERLVAKGKLISEERSAARAKIASGGELEALAACDLVVEAACAGGDSPVNSSTVLSRAVFGWPQHS